MNHHHSRVTPPDDGPLALDARHLSISFGGVRALSDVSVRVRRGEITCLSGENGSGKSTFVKIVSGVYAPDAGEVHVDGRHLATHHPRAAIAAGVQVIYQDLSLFEHLTVAENIAMNRMLHDGTRFVSPTVVRDVAAEQLRRVDVQLDLDAPLSAISVASKQVVAICRALAMDAKVLFMDEPTTALTTKEVDRLLRIVTQLRERGLAIVFISHKLDEVMRVADTITVFRDGRKVGDFAAADIDEGEIAFHMTGRRVRHERYVRGNTDDAPLLEVADLTRRGNYEDVSFAVRPGDILGVTGLLGSGRTELALSLFGLNPPDAGTIRVRGRDVKVTSPTRAQELGLALVPEQRQLQGLFMNYSIARNASAPQLGRVTSAGLLSPKKETALANDVIERMGVNNRDPRTIVGNLSGGNAQKVVIGRGIATAPSVYVLDSPTVGVDIGAKSEIYGRIHRMAAEGMGVILISDEPEEITANCNRVLVMRAGRIAARFEAEEVERDGFRTRLADLIAGPGTDGDALGADGDAPGADGDAPARGPEARA